jgi:hypothetical protein
VEGEETEREAERELQAQSRGLAFHQLEVQTNLHWEEVPPTPLLLVQPT